MEKGQVLFLNEEEIKSILTNEKTLEIVEDVLKAYGRGEALNPVKLSMPMVEQSGRINSMPSYNTVTGATGVKVVSVFLNNAKQHGLLTTLGTIILHDPETGMPLSIMGGTYITSMRTGAAAALKAKYLARKDSKIVTVVGAGVQGFTGMDMMLTILEGDIAIEEVRVSDPFPAQRAKLISKLQAKYPNIRYVEYEDNPTAAKGADILLMASAAPFPLLENCEIDEGTLCICISERLTPKAIGKFDRFYADFKTCVLERANDYGRINAMKNGTPYVELTPDMITGEIGDVMVGKTPGRLTDSDRLLTRDAGMSIEDIGVAYYVYQEALARGIGQVLDFQNLK